MTRMPTEKIRVYFTVDTESSMNRAWVDPSKRPLSLDMAVFGHTGSKSYGIPLIMDILEAHNFRGTFFTEVLCSHVLGDEAVGKVFSYIRQRGHDTQLHLHPTYYHYYRYSQGGEPPREQDLMYRLPVEEQEQLFSMGVALFKQFEGKAPRAYRAGCYGASEQTLEIIKRHGIEIDSSYNLCYLDQTCGFRHRPLNGPRLFGDVQEFPVTNFRVEHQSGYKPLEICAVSVAEILRTIDGLAADGCRDVVVSLHSFSFMKRFSENGCQPDRVTIQRFKRLCKEIALRSDEIEVCTMGDTTWRSNGSSRSDSVPSVGWARPLVRKVVQGVNRIPWV